MDRRIVLPDPLCIVFEKDVEESVKTRELEQLAWSCSQARME